MNDNSSSSTTSGKPRASKGYKAIAGGVTTIMLIALAVVAAGAVAAAFAGSSSTSQSGVKAIIENAEVVRNGPSGMGMWVVTVKNTGTVHITSAAVALTDVGVSTITINDIAPGQTKSGSVNFGSGLAAPGTTYRSTATYTGAGGATATEAFIVTVGGV
jgi:hypothetical protein